jgi:hypothetical protein
MMAQELFLNVLDPMYARYIKLRPELETYLTEKYGEGIDFRVSVRFQKSYDRASKALMTRQHESDRWVFMAPEELGRVRCALFNSNILY